MLEMIGLAVVGLALGGAPTPAHEDHLEPERSPFQFAWHAPYDTALIRTLKLDRDAVVQLTVLPSSEPELAVMIVCARHQCDQGRVEVHRATRSVWASR